MSTSPTYTFTVTSSQTPLVANFVVSYSVTVSASPSNGGSVTGGGNFNDGSNVTVTATPNTGFAFVNWTQNGTGVSTLASYTFTLIANRTLVANFLPSVGTPTISPNGGTYKKKVTLTMSCATAGALIYYTTDGTAPTATSSVYPTAVGKKKPKGISIAGKGSHIVKAKGVKNGSADSAITTATFTIN